MFGQKMRRKHEKEVRGYCHSPKAILPVGNTNCGAFRARVKR